MKVDNVQQLPTITEEEKMNEEQVQEQKIERRIKKVFNKEGVEKNIHQRTDEEKSERAIRRKPRDIGPYYRYG